MVHNKKNKKMDVDSNSDQFPTVKRWVAQKRTMPRESDDDDMGWDGRV